MDDPAQLEYAVKCAYFKARELRGKYGYTETDLEDLQAELLLRLVSQVRHYNPARGKWSTFLNNIYRNHLLNLVDFRHAQCRDYRQTVLVG